MAVNQTLSFAPGETTRTFNVTILDDNIAEGTDAETIILTLSNPSGNILGAGNTAAISILDNEQSANPLEQPSFFVTQQYRDFLGREPDVAGLNYWVGQITSCGANAACISRRRVEVSAAFFNAPEFFDTGGVIYRTYRAAFQRVPLFQSEFSADLSTIRAAPTLGAGQLAFANSFVTRPAFRARYDGLNSIAYVDALLANAGMVLPDAERAFIINSLAIQTLTRAQVLLFVATRRTDDLPNQAFFREDRNRLFVLIQYFGYLRRDPDTAGFNFWFDVLNRTNNVTGMVCAFITSAEYQLRFGPVTRSNSECSVF